MTTPLRRLAAPALLVGVAALPLVGGSTEAATPDGGRVAADSPSVSWQGGDFLAGRPLTGDLGCAGPSDPTCDHFALEVDGPDAGFTVEIEVTPDNGADDLDIHVFDPDGNRIATAETYDQESGAVERVVIADPPDGTYTISVMPYAVYGTGDYAGVAALAGDGPGDVHGSPLDGMRIDNLVATCTEPLPVILDVSGVTDDGARVSLDVHILLDGISVSRAQAITEKSKESYREQGIDLNVVAYDDTFSAPGMGVVTDLGGGSRDSIYAWDLFAAAKAHVGGERPAGSDLVYVMTDKELMNLDEFGEPSKGLLGQADCIGGVRFPDRAFAIGEAWADTLDSVPAEQTNASVIVMAHELGHLMGAHHHYGECATGQRPHESNRRLDPKHPCTLMFPSAGPNNLPFSALNGLVVRGHASQFARP